MPVPPHPLPPVLRGQAFTTATARAAGVSSSRLRRADLDVPFRGVRVPVGSEPHEVQRLQHYGLRLPSTHVFVGPSAARLHGLWLPDRLRADPTIHVGVGPDGRRRRGKGIRGYQVAPGVCEVVQRHGVPVVSAADTWAELTALLDDDELVLLGDRVLDRRRPAATRADLEGAAARRSGRRGCQALVRALERVRAGTDSVKESELRLLVLSWGVPEPTVNYRLLGRSGEFLALLDLAFEEQRVALEYDGGQHRTDDRQFRRDIDRLDAVMDLGWRVLRVGQRQLGAGAADLRTRLSRALRDGGWRDRPSVPDTPSRTRP